MDFITITYIESIDGIQGTCSCGWASNLFAGEDAPLVDMEIFEHENETGHAVEAPEEDFRQAAHEEWLSGASQY